MSNFTGAVNELPYICAIDFDGTLVKDAYPAIGEINEDVVNLAKIAKAHGHKLILWTCRNGIYLTEALAFCHDIGLEFDAVNTNLPEVIDMWGGDTRKVYANEYWDDKAVIFLPKEDVND